MEKEKVGAQKEILEKKDSAHFLGEGPLVELLEELSVKLKDNHVLSTTKVPGEIYITKHGKGMPLTAQAYPPIRERVIQVVLDTYKEKVPEQFREFLLALVNFERGGDSYKNDFEELMKEHNIEQGDLDGVEEAIFSVASQNTTDETGVLLIEFATSEAKHNNFTHSDLIKNIWTSLKSKIDIYEQYKQL